MFYEQYVKIWQDATAQLLLTLIAIFICTFILLSFDLFTSLIVTGVIAIIIIDMVGIMYLWDIELNAISLVNLVIVSIIFYHNSSFLSKRYSNLKFQINRLLAYLLNSARILRVLLQQAMLKIRNKELLKLFTLWVHL